MGNEGITSIAAISTLDSLAQLWIASAQLPISRRFQTCRTPLCSWEKLIAALQQLILPFSMVESQLQGPNSGGIEYYRRQRIDRD